MIVKTILIIIVLGTKNGLGGLVEPPRFYTQEFDSVEQCEVAKDLAVNQDHNGWGNYVSAECVTK